MASKKTRKLKKVLDADIDINIDVHKNTASKNSVIINVLSAVKKYYNSISNRIRVNVYERAIYQLKKWPYPIKSGRDVLHLQGIGKGIIEKIDIILATGTLPIIDEKKIIVEDLFNRDGYKNGDMSVKNLEDLRTVLVFGEKFVVRLKNDFGITTVSELEKRLADIDKSDKSDKSDKANIPLTRQQSIGLKWHSDLNKPVPRSETQSFYNKILDTPAIISLIDKYKLIIKLAGSFPSGKKSSKDIDLLIATPKPEYITRDHLLRKVVNAIKTAGFCLKLEMLDHGTKGTHKMASVIALSQGNTKFLGLMTSRDKNSEECIYRHVDIRLVTYKAYPFARFYYSSGKVFNIMIRSALKKKGYKLNEWGLWYDDDNNDNNDNNGHIHRRGLGDWGLGSREVNLADSKVRTESLDEYADRIEKKIFNIAGIEYRTITER